MSMSMRGTQKTRTSEVRVWLRDVERNEESPDFPDFKSPHREIIFPLGPSVRMMHG